jgi:acetyl-CoA C-acetyltransferase
MPDVYIQDWVRTPRGKRGLSHLSPIDLVNALQEALVARGLVADSVADVVLGVASQTGAQGADLARTANLRVGWDSPGVTINRFCASGIDAVATTAARIRAGDLGLAVAGGVESVSHVPIFSDGGTLWREPYSVHMGIAADLNATLEGFTREELDDYAVETHTKAAAAWAQGHFDRSVVRLGLDRDELIREVTADKLAELPPVFTDVPEIITRRFGPTRQLHTVGTSPQMADGAALMVLGTQPGRARIVASATATCDPLIMLTAGQTAMERAIERAGLTAEDIDVFEFAEAFSALCLRFRRDLGAGPERMNPNGGTMAMGHAFGATGTIMVGQCLDELERRGGRYGVAGVSGAAGMGVGVVIERQ